MIGICLGAVTLATGLPCVAMAADVRVTPDHRPGSYTRHDGASDSVHERCSTARQQQQETTVAVNPRRPSVIAAGAMDACWGVRSPVPIAQAQNLSGYYLSEDGGRTWRASLVPGYPGDDSPAGTAIRRQAECTPGDPTMSFDNEGRLFYGYMCPALAGSLPHDFFMHVATYEDDGRRFRGTVRADRPPAGTLEPQFAPDKPNLVVDQTHGRFSGRVYMVWTQCARNGPAPCFDGSAGYLEVARSRDHGRSFDPPVRLPSPPAPFPQFADLAVGPDGVVYVAFRTRGTGDENAIWLSRSLDGAGTFSDPVRVATVTRFDSRQHAGESGNDPLQGAPCGDGPFRCESGYTYGPFRTLAAVAADRRGVHVTYNERVGQATLGQSAVFVRTSPDGARWPNPPVRVSPQARGHQWSPDITSSGGTISLLFLDSRVDAGYTLEGRPPPPPGNTLDGRNSGPAVDAYLVQSGDGGRSWQERRLSSVSQQPNYETFLDARTPWLGDYIYISSVGGGGFAVWPDTRDLVRGSDTRPDSEPNGFDVHAPCSWLPNTVDGPPTGYLSPRGDHPCLAVGGLDVNVYGAAFDALAAKTRRRPRIRLTVTPGTITAGRRVRLRFHATVGDRRRRPVRAALVRFAGRRARTGAGGRATLIVRLRRPGRVRARATRRGLRSGSAVVRVVRPGSSRARGDGQRAVGRGCRAGASARGLSGAMALRPRIDGSLDADGLHPVRARC